jgi:hypothetical protein
LTDVSVTTRIRLEVARFLKLPVRKGNYAKGNYASMSEARLGGCRSAGRSGTSCRAADPSGAEREAESRKLGFGGGNG